MSEFLISKGFERSQSDRCLLFNGNSALGLYVDDLMICGPYDDVKVTIEILESKFKLRKSDELEEFVGCQFKWNEDHKSVILHQSRISNKIVENFKDEIGELKIYKTPGVYKTGVTQLDNI